EQAINIAASLEMMDFTGCKCDRRLRDELARGIENVIRLAGLYECFHDQRTAFCYYHASVVNGRGEKVVGTIIRFQHYDLAMKILALAEAHLPLGRQFGRVCLVFKESLQEGINCRAEY